MNQYVSEYSLYNTDEKKKRDKTSIGKIEKLTGIHRVRLSWMLGFTTKISGPKMFSERLGCNFTMRKR